MVVVASCSQDRGRLDDSRATRHHDDNVKLGLRTHPSNCSAADMIDGDYRLTNYAANLSLEERECDWPCRIVWNEWNGLRSFAPAPHANSTCTIPGTVLSAPATGGDRR